MVESLLKSQLNGERLELAAGGSWTAANASELETLVDRAAGEARASEERLDRHGGRARVRHVRRLAVGAPHPRLERRPAASR